MYAIEFLHCNVYNKIKAIPRKDCACIVQYASLAQHETCLLNNHVIICAKLERCNQDAYKIQ